MWEFIAQPDIRYPIVLACSCLGMLAAHSFPYAYSVLSTWTLPHSFTAETDGNEAERKVYGSTSQCVVVDGEPNSSVDMVHRIKLGAAPWRLLTCNMIQSKNLSMVLIENFPMALESSQILDFRQRISCGLKYFLSQRTLLRDNWVVTAARTCQTRG